MNKIAISGRLVRDPETKTLTTGTMLTTFTIAVDSGGDDRPAQFFDCEAWKQTAEALSHAHKGDEVCILGALKQSVWTNAEGKQRSKVTVIAWNAEFFGKPQVNAHAPAKQHSLFAREARQLNPADIPF